MKIPKLSLVCWCHPRLISALLSPLFFLSSCGHGRAFPRLGSYGERREEVIALLCRFSTHVFCLSLLLSTLLTRLFSCANCSLLKGLKTLPHSNRKRKFPSVRGAGGRPILGARVLHKGSLWSEKNAVHSVLLLVCFQVCIC